MHVFAYADRPSPDLSIMAASLEAIGGRLHVLGLGRPAPPLHPPGLASLAGRIAASHAQQARESTLASVTTTGRRETTLKGEDSLRLLRKFFAMSALLDDFPDGEVFLFVDGYDVKIEARSLTHLREAFERLQLSFAASGRGPPGGPVIFSGETNCWPFPHRWGQDGKSSTFVSGDYRAEYVYALSNTTRVRGDEICEHWLRERPHARGASQGPVDLTFPNSGAFIGRVGSLRRLFAFAVETLRLFGDFRDQALVYIMALREAATAAIVGWPSVEALVQVDTGGELLATVHGLDVDAIATQRDVARICDFKSRYAHGHFHSSSSSSFAPGAIRQLPPILHFSGEKKWFFQVRCREDMMLQAAYAGAPMLTVGFLDYDQRTGVQADYPLRPTDQVVPMMWILPLPWPLKVPGLHLVVGTIASSSSVAAIKVMFLGRVSGPQLVGEIEHRSDRVISCSRKDEAVTTRRVPPYSLSVTKWLAGELAGGWATATTTPSLTPSGALERPFFDGVIVGQNGTICARQRSNCSRLAETYCGLHAALHSAWQRLRPAGAFSAGLLWVELRTRDLRTARRLADAARPGRECGSAVAARGGSRDTSEPSSSVSSRSCHSGAPLCAALAVFDFLESLRTWEAARYQVLRRTGSAVFAFKSAAPRPLGGGPI